MPASLSLTPPSLEGPTMHLQPNSFTQHRNKSSTHFGLYTNPEDNRANRRSVSSFSSRHSEDDIVSSKPSLHQILLDQGHGPYTLENFAAFLQSQFCYENLAFWLASRQYKLCAQSLYQSVIQTAPQFNLHVNSTQYLNPSQARQFTELQRKMRAILDTFVLPSSPHELNLSDAVRCRLLRVVAEGSYHPQVLEQARESIMDLMKCSSYPLFLEDINNKRLSSSAGSSQSCNTDSDKSASAHDEHGSWRHKAKRHLKLVSKMLRRN
ncbi:hypothetical protein BGW41_006328 [Actinomortierella wolfii]|nr:hypothetical protein BGW41_006328 [Actinomortierella wolfii]